MLRRSIIQVCRTRIRLSSPVQVCGTGSIRYKSAWFGDTKRSRGDGSQDQIIIEEEKADYDIQGAYISDLKHYLKTTEIPTNLRTRILTTKLTELIHEVPGFASKTANLQTIDNVFKHLYKLHDNRIEKVLPFDDLLTLYRKTSSALLAKEDFKLPHYMLILAQRLLHLDSEVPTDIYTITVDLGASVRFNGVENALSVVVRNSVLIPNDFTAAVLNRFKRKNQLALLTFEAFLSFEPDVRKRIVNDDFCDEYCSFIELLFENLDPHVHEYENLDKNIYRIQELTCGIFGSLSSLSIESMLKLLKLFSDLNSVVEYKDKEEAIRLLLKSVSERSTEEVKLALMKQEIFDETQCQLLLLELSRAGTFPTLHQTLADIIIKDDIKYSAILRLQAKLLSHLQSNSELTADELFEFIRESVTSSPIEDLDSAQDSVVEAIVASGLVSPENEVFKLLQDWFRSEYDVVPSLKVFQYRLESAISLSDSSLASHIFETSLIYDNVHWELDSSPKTQLLLNKLLRVVCDNTTSIMDVFPFFQKVKQHMRSPCNAEALSALSEKMVAEECVGDCIELLKRELPKINNESPKRLLVTPSWAYAHRELFERLYDFTVGFTNEETFETNWVLYGELHKYFAVPFETYLPTMKFFCEKDRLHAALVIFQRVKTLNELHGSHHHLPPSREMYMYLFRTFGDRLYEEGVIEIHEYLKMDISLQENDIDLQNCLLEAYSNLQNIGKARDLFLSMSSNPKIEGGVNEETARIMIKTYTYSDMIYVKKFWDNLSQFGVYPDFAVFRQYLIAHVYHGHVDDAIKLIDDIDDYNLEFSPDLLLAMYNYCLDPEKQKQVAQWALKNHKEEWDDVSQSPFLRTASKYMPESNLLTGGETI